jgi:hypothetical protein
LAYSSSNKILSIFITGLLARMSFVDIVDITLTLRVYDFVSQELRAAEDSEFKISYTKNIFIITKVDEVWWLYSSSLFSYAYVASERDDIEPVFPGG